MIEYLLEIIYLSLNIKFEIEFYSNVKKAKVKKTSKWKKMRILI